MRVGRGEVVGRGEGRGVCKGANADSEAREPLLGLQLLGAIVNQFRGL